MSQRTSVLIADDHPIFRRGLREIIDSAADLMVVAEESDGDAAIRSIRKLAPQVAVLDVNMPGSDGIAVLRAIIEEALPTRAILLTMHKEENLLRAAIEAGAGGYIVKDSAIDEITAAIRYAAAGQTFISPAVASIAVSERKDAKTSPLDPLTKAERRILRLVSESKTSRQIADELFISVRTVDTTAPTSAPSSASTARIPF